jgi:uncharacterized RDD family membrane protein YckC
MPWFYANGGKQIGPVTDAEFEHLERQGIIRPETLVWREGMPEWAPWQTVAARAAVPTPLPVSEALPGNHISCTQCGRSVPREDAMQFGNAVVCSACKPGYVQKLREGAPVAQGLPYAGFWIRVAAYVIDQVIITLVTLPLSLWFNMRMQKAMMGGQLDWVGFSQNLGLSMAWSMSITFLYGWLFIGRFAATPGKMLVKLKVVTGDGGRVSYLRALGRTGGRFVSDMTCMIGYLLALFDDEKRTLHDHICNTRVIYK